MANDPALNLVEFLAELQKRQALSAVANPTRLTDHFTLEEMTHTSQKVDNKPTDPAIVASLRYLCKWILEPVRLNYKKSVRITSGYRSPALNKMIGGATNSQHSKGEAADFHIDGIANPALAKWVNENLTYDQLILEFYKTGIPNSGWVHCSVKPSGNRMMFMTAQKDGNKTVYLPAHPAMLS